jgi:hypothetical protein
MRNLLPCCAVALLTAAGILGHSPLLAQEQATSRPPPPRAKASEARGPTSAGGVVSLLSDPSFLGALLGAFAGLVGAGVGGAATYWASVHQYRTEYRTKQTAALAAVLMEISWNQNMLIHELDRVLPLWLSRRHDSPSAAAYLKEVTGPRPELDVRIYDAFFAELIPSKHGPELKTYYDRLRQVNSHEESVPANSFQEYVRAIALATEIAYPLIDALRLDVGKFVPAGWGIKELSASIAAGQQRAIYMAGLHRTDLDKLEKFAAGMETGWLPEVVRNSPVEYLDAWIIPARRASRQFAPRQ